MASLQMMLTTLTYIWMQGKNRLIFLALYIRFIFMPVDTYFVRQMMKYICKRSLVFPVDIVIDHGE